MYEYWKRSKSSGVASWSFHWGREETKQKFGLHPISPPPPVLTFQNFYFYLSFNSNQASCLVRSHSYIIPRIIIRTHCSCNLRYVLTQLHYPPPPRFFEGGSGPEFFKGGLGSKSAGIFIYWQAKKNTEKLKGRGVKSGAATDSDPDHCGDLPWLYENGKRSKALRVVFDLVYMK